MIQQLPNRDVSALDASLLDARGQLRVVDASVLAQIDPIDLRVWAHRHGVYQFPTTELIGWLREQIGDQKAIEIGAGHGAIGRALGIPITDSRLQERPDIAAYYARLGQPTIAYPADVEKLDALEAVERYAPDVVIGAWITQKWKDWRDSHGNVDGVDEESILRQVKRYILIGNDAVHGNKRIMPLVASIHSPEWLFSRASQPHGNRVYVWQGDKA